MIVMRFGKTRMCLNHVITPEEKVLVVYPNNSIKKSWLDELNLLELSDENITFTTYLSLHKYIGEKWDYIICDEIHMASDKQLNKVVQLQRKEFPMLLMSGSMDEETSRILDFLHFPIVVKYTLEDGIKDGIISDYRIYVLRTHLEHELISSYNRLSYALQKAKEQGNMRLLQMLALKRMRLLHGSKAKKNVVSTLLQKYSTKRILLFSTQSKFLQQLEVPEYSSHNQDEELKNDFCEGKGNILGVLKMFNQGVTVKPLDMIIVHNFSSNSEELMQQLGRCLLMDYKDKMARIFIVSTLQSKEEEWLEKALEFAPKNKIEYINL